MAIFCEQCGMQLNDGSRFCIGCGSPVDSGPAETPLPEQPVYQAPPEQPVYQAPPEQPVYQAPPEQPVYQAPPEQQAYQAPPEQQWYGQQQAYAPPPPPPKKGLSKNVLLIIIIAAAAAAAVIILFVLGVFGDRDDPRPDPPRPPVVEQDTDDDENDYIPEEDIDDMTYDDDEYGFGDEGFDSDDLFGAMGWNQGWPAASLPSDFPKYPNGEVFYYDEDGLLISIINTDKRSFEAFIDSVKKAGFSLDFNEIFAGYTVSKGSWEMLVVLDESEEGVVMMVF